MGIINPLALAQATEGDLLAAHREIGDQLRFARSRRDRSAMNALNAGDIAMFTTPKRYGGRCWIRITNFNPKTVAGYEVIVNASGEVIKEVPMTKWRVSPTLLTKVEPVRAVA